MQDLNADGDNWDDIRDLVEPLRRPRIREAVLAHARGNDDNDDDRRRTRNESRYQEFQIAGRDNERDGDDWGGGDDESALCRARVVSS
jgi:hypothetical protein